LKEKIKLSGKAVKQVILEVNELVIGYSEQPVIQKISFKLNKGEIIALLGENGTGKTTTIYTILALLSPWEGEILINTNRIGFVLEKTGMLPELTIKENLIFFSRLISNNKSLEYFYELIKILGINEFINKKYKELSNGMKKRAEIGRALLNKPELLILDEPTEGIDAIGRYEIKQIIKELASLYGCSVLLTTHNLLEAEDICDGFILLKNGKILLNGKVDTIIEQGKTLESLYLEAMGK